MLIDSRQPMSYTTAQSGDNYRNWWPHPTMTQFTNYSIDLMEQIAIESNNVLNMTRRGYLLATRNKKIDDIISALHRGYGNISDDSIRVHEQAATNTYSPPVEANWSAAPSGVDVLRNQRLIEDTFPSLSTDIANIIHVRRAGEISGQQLGQYMLQKIKGSDGRRLRANVKGIEISDKFRIDVETDEGIGQVSAEKIVIAAGPFTKQLAAMIGVDLPIENVFQQKLAFVDSTGAIPRQLPFSVDLDDINLDWSEEEIELLASDDETARLLGSHPGGAHCRPEGGDQRNWVKLGWAYNQKTSAPQQDLANEPMLDAHFPEIVVRGASQLHPSLKQYFDNFPTRCAHYGGYYSMTKENWPLVGPLQVDGAYVAGALSGFGSMSACAVGAISAATMTESERPEFADDLSLTRYTNSSLMAELSSAESSGLL